MCAFTYIVYFLQGQWTNPSTFPFNVELAQLMPVDLDETNFLDRVVVAHPMKKVLDSTHHRPSKCVVRIDVDDIAIPGDPELTI